MYINVGAPGRCSDSTIFENSNLKKHFVNSDLIRDMKRTICGIDVPVTMPGDSAFKFSTTVMKPYAFNTENTPEQKAFNYNLSKCRRVVENAFGHPKVRFRRVGKGIDNNVENAPKIIKACCVLHNFLNAENDELHQQWLTQNTSDDSRQQPMQTNTTCDALPEAEKIRQALAQFFGKFFYIYYFITVL